ncbi:MAG: SRPBCC family protein [Hyphomonadaceae bacterium]|nr:SRPBCC family protein [Hyphomonadaceae bacterium]
MTKPIEVSLPSDTEVRVTRDFKAPRTLVWQAHTDPKLLQRWMSGMPGWSMPICEMDVRPGGRYRWRWRSDENGAEFGFFGEFKEVDAPAKLTQEEYFDPGVGADDVTGDMPVNNPSVNRSTFTEKNSVTTLIVLIDYGSKAARDAAVSTGMTDGMEISYTSLDALLAEQQGG